MSNNGPSNIRINPFTGDGGATTYVNLTETHIIPSTSPFVVRLNEVPEKQDPSNMKCVWVDSSTGDVTSNALTEVAATPSAGEFRPDYSTKADGNEAWNTGLIEFNSADAGKIVQVTYTGTGTLAGVTSNHWPSWYTDRGDGSDGDFVPTEDTTISGVKNYKRVFIKAGVTVTVKKSIYCKCLGSFVNLGNVVADGQGAKGGKAESSNGEAGYGIGGAGGAGGGKAGHGIGGAGGNVINKDYVFLNEVGYGGGGGGGADFDYGSGVGGDGGGFIAIVTNAFDNQGKITANGTNGTYPVPNSGGGGGGGGGGVTVITNILINRGVLSAEGGIGGASKYKGADGQSGTVTVKQLEVL